MKENKTHIFDNPRNVRRVLYVLYTCCGILFILDVVIHRHMVHPWEPLLAFYAVYGFVGCVVLVLIAKWMRTFLMRDEKYYDREELKPDEQEGEGHVDS